MTCKKIYLTFIEQIKFFQFYEYFRIFIGKKNFKKFDNNNFKKL